jgi:thiol-disulfide isomerase/thioredoxin
LAVAFVLAIVAPATAVDESELRRVIREAGLTPYWSFKPAADFRYPDVTTGRPLTLVDLRGRVVLVNVWATWCPPCIKEMPSLQALHEEFNVRGLVVIGINIRDRKDATTVAKWLMQRQLTFVNVKAHDDGPDFPSGFRIPQTFLIDRSGRLIANKPGAWEWTNPTMKTLIVRLLDES